MNRRYGPRPGGPPRRDDPPRDGRTRSAEELRAALARLDRAPYPAYKELRGTWALGAITLFIDHVQGDPFAAPSRVRVRAARTVEGAPERGLDGDSHARRVALADFLARRGSRAVERHARRGQGSGKSGEVRIDTPGQEVLERSACRVTDEWAELRLSAGLPAAGRSILGREAAELLLETLPTIAWEALRLSTDDAAAARTLIDTVEDAQALRAQLREHRLVAFIADGAILPRASGVSQRPLDGAVPFSSPPELRVTLHAPHAGAVVGMGVPEGLTTIVGGGFHGKSTLLAAIARGPYDHIPGDGREQVVAREDAVVIRAEDGRRVAAVDISPFIGTLPSGGSTARFSTDNASGSTSQAANIVEAIEVGGRVLVMDEDTCATNFLIRDARMRRLVPAAHEPITPFVDRVRDLYTTLGVSTILVLGGSGDYLGVADTVIWMDAYRPHEVTAQAHIIAAEVDTAGEPSATHPFGAPPARIPDPASINAERRGRDRVRARGTEEIAFGQEEIDLRAVEQIVDPSQTRAIGGLLAHAVARGHLDGQRSLADALAALDADLDQTGLDLLAERPGEHPGELARPRMLEVAAAINRLRTLRVR